MNIDYDQIINECMEIMNLELYKKGFNMGKKAVALESLRLKLIKALNQIIQQGNFNDLEPIEIRRGDGKRLYTFDLIGYLNKLRIQAPPEGPSLNH